MSNKSTVVSTVISTVSTVVSNVSNMAVLLGALCETDCAACNTLTSFWHTHNDVASNDRVRTRQVHICPDVNMSSANIAKLAWSWLVVLILVVASRSMLTDVGVEDISCGVASVSQVA